MCGRWGCIQMEWSSFTIMPMCYYSKDKYGWTILWGFYLNKTVGLLYGTTMRLLLQMRFLLQYFFSTIDLWHYSTRITVIILILQVRLLFKEKRQLYIIYDLPISMESIGAALVWDRRILLGSGPTGKRQLSTPVSFNGCSLLLVWYQILSSVYASSSLISV